MRVKEKSKGRSGRIGRAASRARGNGRRPSGDPTWPELRYMTDHIKELEQYRGEWLLIEGYSLVAHSSDIKVIKAAVKRHEIRAPFVHYVPEHDESVFLNLR